MKRIFILFVIVIQLSITHSLNGQDVSNCFLEDFELKIATIPPYEEIEKTTAEPTVTVTINANDTLGKVSRYIFGNAVAAWIGNVGNDPILLKHLQDLSPTLIRYPGGSWSDEFFWDGKPVAIPESLYYASRNRTEKLWPHLGANSWEMTVDNYYNMCYEVDTQGLITINYGYARYGLSEKPAEQAAHYAADWVRYDDGRTRFWEIGNENAGPWEAGWQIDSTLNQDGQPEIITGELYGKHLKIFADSMRKAAEEIGTTIYIGGQILHYDGTSSWNVADRKWNEGFFREVGDAADFYVIHNYFGGSSSPKILLDVANNVPRQMIEFIHKDITEKNASFKPIALTEWNMSATDEAKTSIINGMQAVILFCELIRLNYGMSSRWLIANWEADGMFYKGNNPDIPAWNPRPAFFYIHYLQRFFGDHAVAAISDNKDIVAYASSFNSGEAAVVVVNKREPNQIVQLKPDNYGCGERYYIYSLTGEVIGNEDEKFPQGVSVNDNGPDTDNGRWGPLDDLGEIEAFAYRVGNEIKFTSPAYSVQFVLIESGDHYLSVEDHNIRQTKNNMPRQIEVYPNPTSNYFKIDLRQVGFNRIDIYDIKGRVVYSKNIDPSETILKLQPSLASGHYFVKLYNDKNLSIKKLIISK